MALKTFIEAVRDGLREEMLRDENVIVLGEDVGKKGGVFLATDGLWAEFGDDRVIDTPLTESQIVGTSIGAAIAADITAIVHDATEYAESQPDPDPATAMKWVFAEDWPGETPPPWGFGGAGGSGEAGH